MLTSPPTMLDDAVTRGYAVPRFHVAPFDTTQLEEAFASDGYLVLRGVVAKDELERVTRALTNEFEAWKSSEERFDGGGLMSGHLNVYPGELARGVFNQLKDSRIFELCQKLVPTDPKAVRLGCNLNLPGSVAQHWHVDGAFLERFLIVNVAVVDTVIENGAIDIIPHTHKRFYKYWEFAAGRLARGSVRVSMQRGDVLIRPSTLWHRGMPNLSPTPRPMLAFTLGEKHVSNDDPFAYREGKVEFQMNWFRPNSLGRLRERTTVAAPISYDAYRFVASLFGKKGYAKF